MDPIANMLTQIRNAQAVGQEMARVPFSAMKMELAKILIKEGYLGSVEKRGKKIKKVLELTLKYYPSEPGQPKAPAVSGARRISKSGRRIYSGYKDIRPVKQGFGIGVISTSKGLMTMEEARKARLGGEVICEVW